MSQRRKRNSSKANLVISFVFHSLVVLAVFYFAARQGVMGDKMKSLVATLEQQKPKEPPKPPKEEPKVEPPKQVEQPKALAAAPPPAAAPSQAAPPVDAPPSVAPPTLDASFFGDGAKAVVEVSDPKLVYKGSIERVLRSNWERPEDIKDDAFVAEVELSIDNQGAITSSRWVKGSGNARWDKSVKAAVAATRTVGSAPPNGFPGKFMARFDVEMTRTEDVLKVSSLN
ncbi:MAG TPA: energy transducer TonB [Verrucomicrobiae bacterium]|nr:energy transducer TonB [Verrucomicrobiae bacterium]